MAERLLIVERYNPDLYGALSRRFASDPAVSIVRDRRARQRRRCSSMPLVDRRHADRRCDSEASGQLRAVGLFITPRGNAGAAPAGAGPPGEDATRFTVVVPPDRPEVLDELAQELSGEGVRVILDRRRAQRRGRGKSHTPDLRRGERRGEPGGEDALRPRR